MVITTKMLFFIAITLLLSTVSSIKDQPPGCTLTNDQSSSQSSASASSSSSSSSGGQASSNASAQSEASSSSKGSNKPQKPPCIPTCAEPNPKNCKVNKKYVCEEGYILSKKQGGTCIRIEECPQDVGCNGDKNAAIMSSPLPCPSTCDSPNQVPCKRASLAVGCVCKPGFIASNNGCVPPESCPKGYPCPKNETFVNCKFGCPTNYCPVDDSQAILICDPAYPCPSGCICKLNYRRKSVDNPQCILAQTCPPVNCTRQNEVWSGCPSACLAEDCSDVNNQPTTCNTLVQNCSPRCICEEGYFRNQDGLCVPAEDCPPVNCTRQNEVWSGCPSACLTEDCSDVNNQPTTCNTLVQNCSPRCICEEGYFRNQDGLCVPAEDCPQ